MMDSFDMDVVVPRDLPFFAGHFPAMPLVPGALLLDWAIAEMTARWSTTAPISVKLCKFLLPVLPGDALHFRVGVVDQRVDFIWTKASQLVCTGVLTLAEVA